MIILRQHNYSLFNINYLKGIYDLLENVYGCSPYDSFWQLYPGDEREHMKDAKKQYKEAVKKIDDMYSPNK